MPLLHAYTERHDDISLLSTSQFGQVLPSQGFFAWCDVLQARCRRGRTLESFHGSVAFTVNICSGLEGHRKHKYIWKSLPPSLAWRGCPGWGGGPTQTYIYTQTHSHPPPTTASPLCTSGWQRFISPWIYALMPADPNALLVQLATGSVVLPAHSY